MEGRRYGRLTCLSPEGKPGAVGRKWRCLCRCGQEVLVSEGLMLSGVVTSCGCRWERALNLQGQRFGRLTVLDAVPGRAADGSMRWLCRCDCGTQTIVSSNKLRRGHTRSCGCQFREAMRTSRTYINGTCVEIIASEKLSKNNTSGHKGVSFRRKRWMAYINFQGRNYYLGDFAEKEEAIRIRGEAEQIRRTITEGWLQGREDSHAFAEAIGSLRGMDAGPRMSNPFAPLSELNPEVVRRQHDEQENLRTRADGR